MSHIAAGQTRRIWSLWWSHPNYLWDISKLKPYELRTQNIDYFRSKPVNVPKITILLDHGYHPETLKTEFEEIYPKIMRKIKFERLPKPSKAEKVAAGKTEFIPWWLDGRSSVPMRG